MIQCVSVSHQTADLAFLESLVTRTEHTMRTLGSHPGVEGVVVLSTCSRFEVYLDAPSSDAVTTVADAVGIEAVELAKRATAVTGQDAARHLFSVAAGLESVVVGEDEISGQVSRALSTARETGTASSRLERLFQTATKTSRSVKTRTALGSSGRSIVRLAFELAASRFGDWTALRVLVVGTGRYAVTTVAALRERGAVDIAVHSPRGRAAAFAAKYSLEPVTDLMSAVADADLVITCTSRDHYLIDAGHVSAGRQRLFIDLGMPRNISPDVSRVPHVELLDLELIGLHAPLEVFTAAVDARELIDAAAAQLTVDAAVSPAVVALRRHVLDLLDTELAQHGANPDVERALRHFAGVLLHGPSVRARELAHEGRASEFLDGVRAVFGAEAAAAHTTAARDVA